MPREDATPSAAEYIYDYSGSIASSSTFSELSEVRRTDTPTKFTLSSVLVAKPWGQ
jgi:hypothetical protein